MINIVPKIASKLGSPDSKIPLAVKDIFNSAGCTYFSYDAGGSIEGIDRLADEAGTGAVWLFGIPAYKKLIDKTLYKAFGISPEVDARALKDRGFMRQALKYAPDSKILKELQSAFNNPLKTKSLAAVKFAAALTLTMLSYFGITKLKQNITRLNIEKEFNKKLLKENTEQKELSKNKDIFSEIKSFGSKKFKSSPSFGAGLKLAEEIMLNPVKNMILLDLGISASRLKHARTDGEFKEYALKEGSFLFFVYFADKLIRKGLEFISDKVFKLPIALDAQFLSSDAAEKILKDKNLQKQVKDFNAEFAKSADSGKLYEFLFSVKNAVTEAAKKAGVIASVKDTAGNLQIDTRKYIDAENIKKFALDLENFINKGSASGNIKSFLNKARCFKIVSSLLSIGASCVSLGYLVPKMMYEYRKKHQNGSTDFHVKAEYEKQLAAKFNAAGNLRQI